MDLLTKFDVSIINTPPNKDRLRNASESPDKQCHIRRLNDHFVGSFESERVLAFWKERHLQVGDEIQRARARLEFVEGQIEDDKRQANLDRAKLQRMKRRHKRLRSVAVQKYKNSSNAMESKKLPIYFSHMLLPCPFFCDHVSDLDMVASYAMLPLCIIC
ncbi:unnamed protein product [Prunus brigantina]